jgi:hypothetical protein
MLLTRRRYPHVLTHHYAKHRLGYQGSHSELIMPVDILSLRFFSNPSLQ